jgi:HSP20 family protein
MSTLTRRETRPFLDLFDWVDAPLGVFRPLSSGIRTEAFVKDGHYTVRAELPGIDPEKELSVTVGDGMLTIGADRHEEKIDKTHSEFRYGSVTRRIALPAGADDDHVQASYDKGILEVTIGLKEPAKKTGRRIPVRAAKTG